MSKASLQSGKGAISALMEAFIQYRHIYSVSARIIRARGITITARLTDALWVDSPEGNFFIQVGFR